MHSGQKPKILYIGCYDSRLATEELMGVGPGDVFVHDNIANMLSTLDLSCMSVTDYAVNFILKLSKSLSVVTKIAVE